MLSKLLCLRVTLANGLIPLILCFYSYRKPQRREDEQNKQTGQSFNLMFRKLRQNRLFLGIIEFFINKRKNNIQRIEQMNIENLLRNEVQVIISDKPNSIGDEDAEVIVTANVTHQDIKSRNYDKNVIDKHQQQSKKLSGPIEVVKKACRICLDQEGHFLAPCTCSGSMKYIHYKCLEQWLIKSAAMKLGYAEFKKSKCEVCGTRFNFKSTRERQFDFSMIKKNYINNRHSYLQFGAGFLVIILVMIAIIVVIGLVNSELYAGKILRDYLQPDPNDKVNLNIILIATIFVLISILLIAGIIFFFEYGFYVEIKIIKIENYSAIKTKSYKNLGKLYVM